ncbi:WD domain, G-beta repeat [Thalassoglobus neptunius]|uniref:WD domain, G-beta repeat n=1 Tax=Thalassoglobus neptunius TaxID=1938619 RepID=A0A5C5W194_9PLAN|nr:c-type cytochrome domain-containing protein [Thalassoglobus neptunius]TWT43542.1 WD domain, G-beta repeat [Thalassoglobus neptunius]
MSKRRLSALIILWLTSLATSSLAQSTDDVVTYDQLRPVIRKRCASCHSRNQPRAGLDLSTLSGLQAGSDSGPVVVAGEPENSLLYTVVAHLEEPTMPPGKPKIPSGEIKLLHDWIAGGLISKPGGEPTLARSNGAQNAAITTVTPLTQLTAITAMAMDPKGERIAVSGLKEIVILDAKSHAPLHAFPFPEGEVFSLRFSSDGEWLIAGGGLGGDSGKVIVFEVSSGKRLIETPEEYESVLSADATPDRKYLAWGGPWRSIRIFDVARQEVVSTLTGQTDWVLSVSFSPDGLLVAGSDRFGGIRIWSTHEGKEFWNLRGHTGAVPELVWSPNSDQLLSIGEDGTARIWNLHTGESEAVWDFNKGALRAAAWHSSGQIALGSRNKEVTIVSPEGQVIHEFSTADEVTKLVFDPTGTELLVADVSGRIHPFNTQSGTHGDPLTLPVAQALARIEIPWPQRSRATRDESILPKEEAPPATSEDALLQAVLEAEEAVRVTEESLIKLRKAAASLREALEQRNAE